MSDLQDQATAADRDEADQISWDMGLEGQPLSPDGYAAVLTRVVAERLRREP